MKHPPTSEEPHLVFLAAKDEADLLRASEKLDRRGVEHVIWREPDWGDRPTALATAPVLAGDRWFPRSYPLWRA